MRRASGKKRHPQYGYSDGKKTMTSDTSVKPQRSDCWFPNDKKHIPFVGTAMQRIIQHVERHTRPGKPTYGNQLFGEINYVYGHLS